MSLQRVLEPEVMDSFEEARDYDEMDHAQVNCQFVHDLLAAGPITNEVLDLGTGTAQIPIELCRRLPDVQVVAIDMSVGMLEIARYNLELAEVTEQIMLDRIDAKSLALDDDRFGTVMSNSIIHHIAQPEVVLREAVRVTRPGGLLFFRDLLRPASDAEVRHLVQTYAGQGNDHQRQMFNDSLRAALSLAEIRELIGQLGFAADMATATSDRHWTWKATKPS